MTRISEKVRDIVDVRPYTTVVDFQREPETTLVNYHLTDFTAFMMSDWLGTVVKNDPTKFCRAIAGYRGVGKSHFLAAFSVIMSHPELRSRIAESHVLSSSQELLRRHYPVVNVRRGIGISLLDDINAAVCLAFDLRPETAGSNVSDMVAAIVSKASGLTPIVIIDSAAERSAPIERNDGSLLAEIAEKCRASGIFVGLALDDDIAGADQANAAVAASFNIEYLDQEHLYKVVNSHIFQKNSRTQGVLGSLYNEFRLKVPDFRWSEQRFSSLYPLHPATLELAPFVRSYLPQFTLLGFAAAAGERILGRPADSLIGIDDVFDSVEFEMRKLKELSAAFEVYDKAAAQLAVELPVSARHKAKLVLKALLMNSLSQRGTSAAEIAGSTMLADDVEPGSAVRDIEAMLVGFEAAFPESIAVDRSDNAGTRYRFQIGSDEFADQLNALIAAEPVSTAEVVFRKAVCERFPELSETFKYGSGTSAISTYWRGSLRPGRIILNSYNNDVPAAVDSRCDWEIDLELFAREPSLRNTGRPTTSIEWKVGELQADDRRALISYAILSREAELRNKFPDQFSAALVSSSNAVIATVERVMVTDARLVIDGFDYNFSEAARLASDLPEVIGVMLEPLFEAVYPEHPYFVEPLTPEILDRFVKSLTEGDLEAANADQHALTFGVPLGIVEHTDAGYSVVSKERLAELSYVSKVLEMVEQATDKTKSLHAVESSLAQQPDGLSSEVSKLILSAMAFRGLVEFETDLGQHIGGRSIDLKLDWTQIASVTTPVAAGISTEKLLEWARLISEESNISSLKDPEDRNKVLEAFVEISAQWERRDPLELFEKIPDCAFNTAIWRHSSRTWDEHAAMVVSINETLVGNLTIEECLDRICSNFLDRPQAFYESRISVTAIEDFARSHFDIDRIANYLLQCDTTDKAIVEDARAGLRTTLQAVSGKPCDQYHRELGYAWEKFVRIYTEWYSELHSKRNIAGDFRIFAENTVGTANWAVLCEYRRDADSRYSTNSRLRNIRRRFNSVSCRLDPVPFLQENPYCECRFLPSQSLTEADLALELQNLVERITDEASSGYIPIEPAFDSSVQIG